MTPMMRLMRMPAATITAAVAVLSAGSSPSGRGKRPVLSPIMSTVSPAISPALRRVDEARFADRSTSGAVRFDWDSGLRSCSSFIREIIVANLSQERLITYSQRFSGPGLVAVASHQRRGNLLALNHLHGAIGSLTQCS